MSLLRHSLGVLPPPMLFLPIFRHLDAEQIDDDARRAAGDLTPAEEKELNEKAASRDYTRLKAKRRSE